MGAQRVMARSASQYARRDGAATPRGGGATPRGGGRDSQMTRSSSQHGFRTHAFQDTHTLERSALPGRQLEQCPHSQFQTMNTVQFRDPGRLTAGTPRTKPKWEPAFAPALNLPQNKVGNRQKSTVLEQPTVCPDPYQRRSYKLMTPRARTQSPARATDLTEQHKDAVWDETSGPKPVFLSWQAGVRKMTAEQEFSLKWNDPDPVNFDYRNPKQIASSRWQGQRQNRMGATTLAQFKRDLVRRYGNVVRAWRIGLDRDGSGTLTKDEFGPALRAHGFEGGAKSIWNELDDDGGGVISMNEWDRDVARLLQSFKEHLRQHYETAETAWADMCPKGQMYLKKEQFALACRRLGWGTDTEALKLHPMLCGDPLGCSKMVVLKDILWLGQCDLGVDDDDDMIGI